MLSRPGSMVPANNAVDEWFCRQRGRGISARTDQTAPPSSQRYRRSTARSSICGAACWRENCNARQGAASFADMTDVVALAAELLSIDSSTGAESGAVDFVSKWLVARGWNVTIQEVSRGRANVWASRAGRGVTLSTHLDTVPPYIAPRLDGNKLRGRGACDAKGIAAAMLVAADKLATAGEQRVDLLFVVGEEKGSDGARAANRLAPTSRFLINGEPTESKLASGAKGSLRVTVRTRGRAAHSAYAHLGESAIVPMIKLLPDARIARPADRRDPRRDDGQCGNAQGRHRSQHRSRARRSRDHVPARGRRRSRSKSRSTRGPRDARSSSTARTSPRSTFIRFPDSTSRPSPIRRIFRCSDAGERRSCSGPDRFTSRTRPTNSSTSASCAARSMPMRES